jgi:hypothetical protein
MFSITNWTIVRTILQVCQTMRIRSQIRNSRLWLRIQIRRSDTEDTMINPAVSGFASYFYQEDVLQIGTYLKDGDLPTGTNSNQLSDITVQWS